MSELCVVAMAMFKTYLGAMSHSYVTQVSTERDPLEYSMSPDLCTKEISTLISFSVGVVHQG